MPSEFPPRSAAAPGTGATATSARSGVRKVITRRTKRVVGLFPSKKNNGQIAWESLLERDYCAVLELDPAVLAYRSQPERMTLFVDGARRWHVPDFLVTLRSGDAFHEVKPLAKTQKPDVNAMLTAAAAAAAERGLGYRVVTEEDIRLQPRLANAKLICRYMCVEVSRLLRHDVITRVSLAPTTIGTLTEVLGERGGFVTVMGLIASGTLAIDMDVPLTQASALRIQGGGQ